MKNQLMRAYLYLLAIISLVNLVFMILDYSIQANLTRILLLVVSFLEFPLIVLSIIMIPYIVKRKLKRIYLILPIVYLSAYSLLVFIGTVMVFLGVDLFRLDSISSIIFNGFTGIFYLFNIFFGVYLLKKE